MEKTQPQKSSRRRRKVAQKVEAPLEVVVTEVEASPIVDPAPQPTPVPPQEKILKPGEIVRPELPNDGQTWQRGQKWRP